MVKCHVVDVHMTPLRESQHTYHQNIERVSNSHDYLQHDFSRGLKNKGKLLTNNIHAQDQRDIK